MKTWHQPTRITNRVGRILSPRTRYAQRGTSLIEVLVVLIILLIGIFTLVQIFPIGFSSLRATESRTVAGRLAQQLQEQIKADDSSIPLGVLASNSAGDGSFVANLDPDDLTDGVDSTGAANSYFSDINKFRFIKGEPAKVPLPTSLGSGYAVGSLYTLKYGPIYLDPSVGDPNAVATDVNSQKLYDNYLRVYGPPLTGIQVDSAGGTNAGSVRGFFRNSQTTYLIDYADGGQAYILFAPYPKDRTFNINYSYESGGAILSETSSQATIVVPAYDPTKWGWLPIPNPSNPAGSQNAQDVLAGSETVNRNFVRLAANTAFSTGVDPNTGVQADPYEYKLISANVPKAGTGTTYANVGVLAFNPTGANYSERTPNGQRAFTAYIDYSVLDWHILHEDREVPNAMGTQVPIRTVLGYIKRVGDPEPDNTAYQGLYREARTDAKNPDASSLQIFDLQGTSTTVQAALAADPTNSGAGLGTPLTQGLLKNGTFTPDTADYWVDSDTKTGTYRTGTIYLNPKRLPAGTKIRILYKAEGEWAVGLQKSYSVYHQAVDAKGNVAPFPGVTIPADDTKPVTGGYDVFGRKGTNLYFQRNDLNKSIVAVLEYTKIDPVTKEVSVVRTTPIQMTLNATYIDTTQARPVQYATVDVSGYMPNRDTTKDWRVVGTVSGVSLKTRVIWKDNASDTNSWRVQDVDTYITQGNGS